MNDLVFVEHNEPFTTSEIIAQRAGITHHAVQVLISKYENDLKEFGVISFEMRKPPKSGNGGRPEITYRLNEEQAMLLFTYFKNTEKVRKFKKDLVRQFCAMRRILLERQTLMWQDTRQLTKEAHKIESDAAKRLVDYSSANGSTNAARYYGNLAALANKTVGIIDRDFATMAQLNTLILLEQLIARTIDYGITVQLDYHSIFNNCKSKAQAFKALIGVSQLTGSEVL